MSDYDSEVRREAEINNQSQELLPCPFCGAKTTYGNFGEALCSHHKDCWIAGLRGHDNSNMLAKWNTRHTPNPPLPEQIKYWPCEHIIYLDGTDKFIHTGSRAYVHYWNFCPKCGARKPL